MSGSASTAFVPALARFAEAGILPDPEHVPSHLRLYAEQADRLLETVRGTVDRGEMPAEKADEFERLIVDACGTVMCHPIIADNRYLARFAQGVTLAQARHELQQFSVFGLQFDVAQAKLVANARTPEAYLERLQVLLNEKGIPYKQGFDGELSGRWSLKTVHFTWMQDTARGLGLTFEDLGKIWIAQPGTRRFVEETFDTYASTDQSVAMGASFAIENWAANALWTPWIAGMERLNATLATPVDLGYLVFHEAQEAHHSQATLDELLEAFLEPWFDREKFFEGAERILTHGVQAYYESQLASLPERDETWPDRACAPREPLAPGFAGERGRGEGVFEGATSGVRATPPRPPSEGGERRRAAASDSTSNEGEPREPLAPGFAGERGRGEGVFEGATSGVRATPPAPPSEGGERRRAAASDSTSNEGEPREPLAPGFAGRGAGVRGSSRARRPAFERPPPPPLRKGGAKKRAAASDSTSNEGEPREPLAPGFAGERGRGAGERQRPTINPLPLKAIHHVELLVGNARQAAYFYRQAFGFSQIAYAGPETGVRDQASYVLQQGDIRLVVSTPLFPDDPMAGHLQKHGDGVLDVAFLVDDVDDCFAQAVARGARPAREPYDVSHKGGLVRRAKIRAYGDTLHSFISLADYAGPFLPGYEPSRRPAAGVGLKAIDHIVGNVEHGRMNDWGTYYNRVLGFHQFMSFDDKDVSTEFTALRSKVMADPSLRIKFPINEPAPGRRKSQIQEFLDYNAGPGVQHIALLTDDIVHTVSLLRERGVEFLDVPDSYYDAIFEDVHVSEDHESLRRLRILIDHDEKGYLLQTFTRPVEDRPTLFFEIIQREGCEGFGKGNFRALFAAIEREQAKRGNLVETP